MISVSQLMERDLLKKKYYFIKKCCVDNDIIEICQTMDKDKESKQISNDMQDGCKG